MSQVNGVTVCYNGTNLCDLHPVCDDALDEIECDKKYEEKGLFKKGATFLCQSLLYNEDTVKNNLSRGVVWIKAVPQDGIPECWNNVDEDPMDQYKIYGILGNIQTSSSGDTSQHSSSHSICF